MRGMLRMARKGCESESWPAIRFYLSNIARDRSLGPVPPVVPTNSSGLTKTFF